jgi:DNA-binding NarL/FixJ family response regulator
MDSPTVLIVDDHESFRTFASRLLTADGLQVVGLAIDGASAIEQALELAPDLVLLDIGLPDLDGFEVARHLRRAPGVSVVLTSSRDSDDYGDRIAASGVLGFLRKDELSGGSLRRLVGNAT